MKRKQGRESGDVSTKNDDHKDGLEALFWLVGGNNFSSAALIAGIGRLGFEYSVQYFGSIENAVSNIARRREAGAFNCPNLLIIRAATLVPNVQQALSHLRQDSELRSVPFMVVTQIDDPVADAILIEAGALAVARESDVRRHAVAVRDAVVKHWSEATQ